MTESSNNPEAEKGFSFNQVSRWLSSRSTFSIPLAIFALVWPVLTGLGGHIPTGSFLPISIHLYDLFGSAALCIGVLMARISLEVREVNGLKPIYSLFVFALISASAAIFQYFMTSSFGPISEMYLTGLPITALVSFGQLLTFILVVRSVSELRQAAKESLRIRQNLLFLRQNLDKQLLENRRLDLEQVQSAILPTLEGIQRELSRDSENQVVAHTLKKAIDEKVRPLSHSLYENSQTLTSNQSSVQNGAVSRSGVGALIEALRQPVPISSLFPLPLFAITTAVFVLPGYWSIYGIEAGLSPAAISISLLWLVWFVFQRLVKKCQLAFIWQVPLAAAIATVGALLFLEANLLIGQGSSLEFSILQTVNLGVISFVASVFSSIQAVRWQKVVGITKDNQSLELLNSKLRQDLWLNRRRLAKLIHGSAQARLQVAYLTLQKPQATEVDRTNAANSVQEIVEELTNPSSEPVLLREAFEDLRRLWQGVCDISISIDQQLLSRIEADVSVSGSLDEFVREAVTNAVKHSKTSKVEVRVLPLEQDAVSVSVRNSISADFQKPMNSKSGMGIKLFDAVSASWSLVFDDSFALLQGTIPFFEKTKA